MKLEARRIFRGRVRGEALVFQEPLSLLGDIDKDSGEVLDEKSGLAGTPVAGKVLVFPRGKGSTAGSYVLYSLMVKGRAPAALVCERAEAVVATGAIISEIPMVDGVQTDLFRIGDTVTVDADGGVVVIEGVQMKHVVTAFLSHRDKVLILKRSGEVGSFPGHWAGVSGHLEGEEEAVERAEIEIREETGMKEAKHVNTGDVVLARGRDGDVVWAVHPFMFRVDRPEVTLDWEHVEYRWIKPEDLTDFLTVPKLAETLASALAGLRRP